MFCHGSDLARYFCQERDLRAQRSRIPIRLSARTNGQSKMARVTLPRHAGTPKTFRGTRTDWPSENPTMRKRLRKYIGGWDLAICAHAQSKPDPCLDLGSGASGSSQHTVEELVRGSELCRGFYETTFSCLSPSALYRAVRSDTQSA